jgi:HEAT repeat protein
VDSLYNLLQSNDRRIQKSALKALSIWPDENIPNLESILTNHLSSDESSIRELATDCLLKLDVNVRSALAIDKLDDIHPEVRLAASKILFEVNSDVADMADWVISNNGSSRCHEVMLRRILMMNPDRRIIEKLAHHYASDAISLLDAHKEVHKIQETSTSMQSGIQILNYALEERSREMIDLALIAAGEIEDPFTIGAIRAGIKSKERRHWANSCEAVRYIQDKSLASSLTIVLEKLGEELNVHDKKKQTKFAGLNSILAWLEVRNDPWLQQCIQNIK